MLSTKLFDLSGRVAVVTGGIGRGIALGLAQAGSAVAVLARNEEKNQRVMDEIHALGVPALAVKIDLAERGQLQPALDKVEKKLGPINILVNNAGIIARGSVLDLDPEDWDRVFETNLNACFLLSKLVARSAHHRFRVQVKHKRAAGGKLQLDRCLQFWKSLLGSRSLG
jgi:2-dehydro-3-deoxy-D-gluconate 5-dehydrogenase